MHMIIAGIVLVAVLVAAAAYDRRRKKRGRPPYVGPDPVDVKSLDAHATGIEGAMRAQMNNDRGAGNVGGSGV